MENCLDFTYSLCIPQSWIELAKILLSVATLVAAFFGLNNWTKQLKGSRRFEIQSKLVSMVNGLQNKVWSFEKVFSMPEFNEYVVLKTAPKAFDNILPDVKLFCQEYEELRTLFSQEKYWVIKKYPDIEGIINNIQMYNYYLLVLYPTDEIKKTTATFPKNEAFVLSIIEERKKYHTIVINLVDKFNAKLK